MRVVRECVRAWVCLRECVCARVRERVCVCARGYVCVSLCVCVYVCVCVCVAGGVACSLRRTIAHEVIAYLNFCMSFIYVSLKESLY